MYVLTEACLGTLFALSFLYFGASLAGILSMTIFAVLLFIVIYDLRHMIVPWESSCLLIILSIISAVVTQNSLHALQNTFLGAFIIGIGFLLLYFLSRGRAMGLGDAPIAFALSLFVGKMMFSGLLFSFWIGAIVGIGILVLRRGGPKMGIEVPFIPFLAMGYLLALFTQWNFFI